MTAVLEPGTHVLDAGLNSGALHTLSQKMKTSSFQTENTGQRGIPRNRIVLFGLATLLLVSSFGVASLRAASYNNVQIFVTTSAQLPYSYTYTAYNSTGSQVASSYSNYPAAAFELPSGTYLFTVSAVHEGHSICSCPSLCACPMIPASGAVGSSSTSSVVKSVTTVDGTPNYIVYEPESEYGFAVVDVTSSQTVNIQTMNVTQFPTYQVTVHVSYVNGTAVDNASVSASIIGQWDYWWGSGSNVNMSAHTGSDGTATLTLPVAPSLITAWKWVTVPIPGNETSPPANQTTSFNVGGQKTNVTTIFEVSYLGLSGSATLIPPADQVDITIQNQSPIYWAEPLTAQVTPGTSDGAASGTVANTPKGTPTVVLQTTSTATGQNAYYQPAQIGALGAVSPKPGASLFGSSLPYLIASGIAGVAVVFGVIAATVLGRSKSSQGLAL